MSQFSTLEGIPAQRLKDMAVAAGSRISIVNGKTEWPTTHDICKWQYEDMVKEMRGFKYTDAWLDDIWPVLVVDEEHVATIRKVVRPYGINHRKQKGYNP